MTELDALIEQLQSVDVDQVALAIKALRREGWLEDQSLCQRSFQNTYWQHAKLIRAVLSGSDLTGANLYCASLIEATLTGANLTGADLSHAVLYHADLKEADFQDANLRCADFQNAILTGACNLTEAQLIQTRMLRKTIMPDGQLYDGRYNLPGGLQSAARHRVDMDDPASLADWYGVTTDEYLAGQAWAAVELAALQSDDHDPCP